MNLLVTFRTHWKKSVFGFSALTYGTYYLVDRKHNGDLMQAYCYEALKFSREKVKQPDTIIKRVTIFLNPIANGERGKFLYDKHVAPLLHLSGLDVRLVRLEKNSEANAYMKEIDANDTDCIVVAGGNATLNEVISGLANRPDARDFLKRVPIGIIPLGETNSFVKKWFTNLNGTDKDRSDNENELRLFADSAMSIIKGVSRPAHLIKVTINQNNKESPEDEELKMKKTGAYSLLKENKIYALSEVCCGFMTVTDSNKDNYWYLGFKRLRAHMNRYFMDRYLRRDPIKYLFKYKTKCTGCSSCLNQSKLVNELNDLTKNGLTVSKKNETAQSTQSTESSSFLRVFYKKFFKINPILSKEALEDLKRNTQLKKENLKNLIEKSKKINENCNKVFTNELKQVQIISNINEPYLDSKDEMNSSIATVIVKDPEFNRKDMFLANKKHLTEFEIKKLVSPTSLDKKYSTENYFALEIDGEIYKLNNRPENDLSIKVEFIENCINLLQFDQELSDSIKKNYFPKIYSLSQYTLSKEFSGDSKNVETEIEMPPILPFEKFYFDYWKPSRSTS